MAKKNKNRDNMEVAALKSEMVLLNKRMEEVITILGGNSTYGVPGMQTDVRALKKELDTVKQDIVQMKKQEAERWSIPIKTVPQKIVAAVAFLALILSVAQGVKDLIVR